MIDRDDAPLDAALRRALRENDDLIPTSDAEVERAEAALEDDVQLPERLRSYREPAPARAQRRPRAVGYVGAGFVGAAIAAAALLWLRQPDVPLVTSAGGELVPPRPVTSASAPPVPLDARSRCERGCCAGSDCKTASASLSACPSGIRCASCATDNANGGPYRLRLGTVIPTEAGKHQLPLTTPLELCVAQTGAEASCVPALVEDGGEAWRQLPVVTPLQDLLVGLTLELRQHGVAQPLATWKRAVPPTPEVLCKGLVIQLSDGDVALGRMSAFIEPTHFVELARAASVPSLLHAARAFDITGTLPRVAESSRGDTARFVLTLGPFDKAEAETLRWQALSRGAEAKVGLGLDYVGAPHPLQ